MKKLKESESRKHYEIIPPLIRKLCWNYDAVIVGGYAKYLCGLAKSVRDIDVMVPLHQWPLACRLIPTGAKCNIFGGFTVKTKSGLKIDIWPGDVVQMLCDQFATGVIAFCPKNNLMITLQPNPKGKVIDS